MAFPGRSLAGGRRRICRSDPCNPGNLLAAEPLQGMEVNIKHSAGQRKSSSVFGRTSAIESIRWWSPITLQSKYNCPSVSIVNWSSDGVWLKRSQGCLSSVWKPGGSFAERPACSTKVPILETWSCASPTYLSTSLTLMPKAPDHLWLLLLSCPKPSAAEALARLQSSTQSLAVSIKPTCILPQWCFFLLRLYNHIAIQFEWLPQFHHFMLKRPYPLTGLLLCAGFSSTLSSDSFAPPALLTLPVDFSFFFTKHTSDVKSAVDL